MGIVAPRDSVKKWAKQFKSDGLKVVTTNGCFDILHVGHLNFLKQCSDQGDILIVGINSDESVKRLKGDTRPIFPQSERAEMLAALEVVNLVTFFDEDDLPIEFIKDVVPDIHIKGGDYTLESMPETKIVEEIGGEVVILPYTSGVSTSKIMERIYHAWIPNP
ncbi:MAG: D-glycero-beta-D-manno-heptose 1-phosphate adenylyltransferase [Clostridia bacterium]